MRCVIAKVQGDPEREGVIIELGRYDRCKGKEHDRGSTRTARNCRKVRGIQFSVERTLLLLCGRLTVRFRHLVEHIGDDL